MSIRGNCSVWLAMVTMGVVVDARAQQPTDIPVTAPRVQTVIAGEHYSAGSVHRFLFGNDYRKLWTAPIQIAELDCTKYGGGLTAARRVGGQQTRGLAFQSVDGRSFTFRGLDKDPSDILPPDYQGTIVDRILQDQIASSLPGGTVAVPPILEAAGVLHAEPFLVVLPDDPALGEFREMFGGLLGTFEEFPVANEERSPGTHGATEIINGEEMWKRMDASADTRPDSRALLKARLIDILIGDWDRHRGQWRWAKLPDNDLWQPIPEDRDQAFVRFEGVVINAGQIRLPQFVSFEEDYPGIEGLTWNGRDVDRRILVDLEKPVWDGVAAELKSKITDDVIAEAIGRLPDEYEALEGGYLQTALRKRRDALPEISDKFYGFLARDVDIHGTNQDDVVTISSAENGDVTVALQTAQASSDAATYCSRTFHPDETEEIRVYLGGGNDRVEANGEGDKIVVRVLPGHGSDVVEAAPEADLRVSDSDTVDVASAGSSLHLDTRPYTAPVREKAEWIPPRDWGRRNIFYPWISANSDIGFLFVLAWQSEGYGFRKDPYADRHLFRLGYATKAGGFGGDYRGEFRRENSRAYSGLYVRGSGLDFLHYYGFGNETEVTEDEDFYKVKQSLYKIEPSYTMPVVGDVMGTIRANVTYAKTKLDGNHLINQEQPYGAEDFLQYGAGVGLSYDTRDSDIAPMKGAHVTVDGTVFPEWSDVVSTFGEVHGEAAYYQPIGILSTPTLALRAGGKKLWREFPYHEAAYIGGSRSVRGFPQQRFAGDASAYASTELRIPISRIYIFVPGNLGLFGLYDIGRVYLESETSNSWHSSYGGGLWATFINTANTASLAVAASEEDTRLYLIAGFAF